MRVGFPGYPTSKPVWVIVRRGSNDVSADANSVIDVYQHEYTYGSMAES